MQQPSLARLRAQGRRVQGYGGHRTRRPSDSVLVAREVTRNNNSNGHSAFGQGHALKRRLVFLAVVWEPTLPSPRVARSSRKACHAGVMDACALRSCALDAEPMDAPAR